MCCCGSARLTQSRGFYEQCMLQNTQCAAPPNPAASLHWPPMMAADWAPVSIVIVSSVMAVERAQGRRCRLVMLSWQLGSAILFYTLPTSLADEHVLGVSGDT